MTETDHPLDSEGDMPLARFVKHRHPWWRAASWQAKLGGIVGATLAMLVFGAVVVVASTTTVPTATPATCEAKIDSLTYSTTGAPNGWGDLEPECQALALHWIAEVADDSISTADQELLQSVTIKMADLGTDGAAVNDWIGNGGDPASLSPNDRGTALTVEQREMLKLWEAALA